MSNEDALRHRRMGGITIRTGGQVRIGLELIA
jgi:hypothetical protein